MTNPPDAPPTKGRGSLIALTALALSASVPLATAAQPAERGKNPPAASRANANSLQALEPGCSDGAICRKPVRSRRPVVGIPGRPDKR